jgi:hypothetical protein
VQARVKIGVREANVGRTFPAEGLIGNQRANARHVDATHKDMMPLHASARSWRSHRQ